MITQESQTLYKRIDKYIEKLLTNKQDLRNNILTIFGNLHINGNTTKIQRIEEEFQQYAQEIANKGNDLTKDEKTILNVKKTDGKLIKVTPFKQQKVGDFFFNLLVLRSLRPNSGSNNNGNKNKQQQQQKKKKEEEKEKEKENENENEKEKEKEKEQEKEQEKSNVKLNLELDPEVKLKLNFLDKEEDNEKEVMPIKKPIIKSEFNFHKNETIDGEFDLAEEFFGLDARPNKYPIVNGHILFVPNRIDLLPQFLTSKTLGFTKLIFNRIPNIMLSYNSIGAFSSVNHFHLHGIPNDTQLPILSQTIKEKTLTNCEFRYKTAQDWPQRNIIFEDPDHGNEKINKNESIESNETKKSFDQYDQLINFIHTYIHDKDGNFINKPIYYNILFTKTRIYLFPRKNQRSFQRNKNKFGTGLAWLEACGIFISANVDEFNQIDVNTCEQIQILMRNESIKIEDILTWKNEKN
ncbi:gdp-d-glucose phosphorylase 1 [Anaeramoeba flamelloides]|uniref:Gdp-d-glucose phosphorylase 1 n=1 Tax=Anaeramoeba flamelloides TaxID=1746091 RepID=A0ABQ8YL00_9EUKA|nr:gdp-d-glucose phosphorylase 1 [Anaeramoeba flamelloides]